MSIISYPHKLPVTNHLTGETWQMCSVDSTLEFFAADYEALVSICNEPRLYEYLFKDKLSGRPYNLDDARSFVDWANDGWRQQSYFVFLIKDLQGKIAAAIDIKSNSLEEAEIGYWSSETRKGVVTNAVIQLLTLANEAGYKKLFANIRETNIQSQGVLLRAGFSLEQEFTKNGYRYYRYVKSLA